MGCVAFIMSTLLVLYIQLYLHARGYNLPCIDVDPCRGYEPLRSCHCWRVVFTGQEMGGKCSLHDAGYTWR